MAWKSRTSGARLLPSYVDGTWRMKVRVEPPTWIVCMLSPGGSAGDGQGAGGAVSTPPSIAPPVMASRSAREHAPAVRQSAARTTCLTATLRS